METNAELITSTRRWANMLDVIGDPPAMETLPTRDNLAERFRLLALRLEEIGRNHDDLCLAVAQAPHVCLFDVEKRPEKLYNAAGVAWWVWPDCCYELRSDAMGWLAGCEAEDHGAQPPLPLPIPPAPARP